MLTLSVVVIACAVGFVLSVALSRVADNSILANMVLAALFIAAIGFAMATVAIVMTRSVFAS